MKEITKKKKNSKHYSHINLENIKFGKDITIYNAYKVETIFMKKKPPVKIFFNKREKHLKSYK